MFALTDLAISVKGVLQQNTSNDRFVGELPQPKAFARALACLAELTQNSERRVIIVGGEVIKWFDMISRRFFELSVSLIDGSGTQMSDQTETRHAQLVLVYSHDFTSAPELTSYNIDEKVVLEPVPESSQLLKDAFLFKNRTTWDSALSTVFGKAYINLDKNEEVATAIGSIARIFEGLATGESEFDIDLVSPTSRVTTASYGEGLITTINNYFPELSRHAGKIRRMSKQTWAEATAVYPQTMRQIESNCACTTCTPGSLRPPEDGFCRSVLLETVVAMALVLSRTILTPGLFPSQSGIGILYERQARKKINVRKDEGIAVFSTIYGDGWNASDALILQQCTRIFSGYDPIETVPDDVVGLSYEGICAYLIKLEGAPRADDPGGSSLVRVTPGVIQQKSKVYTCVRECVPQVLPNDWMLWEELNIKSSSGQLYARSSFR